uniref:Uncharacterized protein n=1 Tax=Oryza sativa subsp. japonica TaxID=39947 RepID=Q7EY57_ORYSJ|nr:hypothetical protein [Oryza sativa Japonica Group]
MSLPLAARRCSPPRSAAVHHGRRAGLSHSRVRLAARCLRRPIYPWVEGRSGPSIAARVAAHVAATSVPRRRHVVLPSPVPWTRFTVDRRLCADDMWGPHAGAPHLR